MSFIFYIAVLLVLLGFVFIYTSLEIKKISTGVSAKKGVRRDSFDDLPEIDLPEEPAASSEISVRNPAPETAVLSDEEFQAEEPPSAPSSFDIVLYSDEKGVSLFDSASGILEEKGAYDEFSRIGSGTAQIGADALSVKIGKKLFRYDYHRVREIRLRDGVAVLYLKGDSRGNIFIAENDLFAKVLDETFTRYTQKG